MNSFRNITDKTPWYGGIEHTGLRTRSLLASEVILLVASSDSANFCKPKVFPKRVGVVAADTFPMPCACDLHPFPIPLLSMINALDDTARDAYL